MARNYGPATGYGYDEIPTWESIKRQAEYYGYYNFAVQGGQLHAPYVSDQVVRDTTMGMSQAMEQSAEIGNVAFQESVQAVDDFVGNEFYDLAHMGSDIVDKGLGKGKGESAAESGKGLSTANRGQSMEKDGKDADGEVLTTRHNAYAAALGEDEEPEAEPDLAETLGHMGDNLGNGLEAWAKGVQERHFASAANGTGDGHGKAVDGEVISTKHETLGRMQDAANGKQRQPDAPEQQKEIEAGELSAAFSGAMAEQFDLDDVMSKNVQDEPEKDQAAMNTGKPKDKGLDMGGQKTPDERYKEIMMDAQRMLDQIDFGGGRQMQQDGMSMG